MAELLSTLTEEWAIRALIASSLVGIMCGVIGSFMVLRNMSLIGDALSHAILPGIFVAFVIIGYSSTGFFVGTLLAALVSAVAMTWIQERINTKNDAVIGIIFTFMFSLGVIGISYLNNQEGVHLDLKDFLFGTVLGVSTEDIIITWMVTIFCITSVIVFYRYLFITTFQPTIAATMGISVKTMHYFLMLLLSFAIVTALRTVGIILVVAMLITPSATALLLSDKLKRVIVISGIIGLISAIIGLLVAILLDTTPGPAMCVVVTIFYFTAVFFSPKNGLVFKKIRKRNLNLQIEKEDILKYLTKNTSFANNKLSEVGSRLNISSYKMKKHLRSLKANGNVIYNNDIYQLTENGKELGLDLVRAHRLWETFLVDKVGLKGDEIHEDAEKYEHLLDSDILDQLDAKLGYPEMDPHGSPIPLKRNRATQLLIELNPRQKASISKTQPNDNIESRLWELGLAPSSIIQVKRSLDEEIVIIFKGQEIVIPSELAGQIYVN